MVKTASLFALALFTLVLAGCAAPATPTSIQPASKPTEAATVAPTEKPTTMASTQGAAPWKADGVIGKDEYAHEATIGDVHLWWRNDAKYLYIAFEAKTSGWVAVGLDPETRMKGANFIIGMMSGGQAKVVDAYGNAEIASHPPDEDLGGKNDIVASAGIQEGGVTRFEVQIPLDSGDKYDKPLKPGGTYKVIAAFAESSEFNVHHSSRATGEITLDAAQ